MKRNNWGTWGGEVLTTDYIKVRPSSDSRWLGRNLFQLSVPKLQVGYVVTCPVEWLVCSVAKSCPTLCNPLDCSMPGFSVPHHFPECAQKLAIHLSRLCHPTISFSLPFCLHLFPVSGSFPVSWLFISGGQSIGPSASVSVLPVNIKGWFPLGLFGLLAVQANHIESMVKSESTAVELFHTDILFSSFSWICPKQSKVVSFHYPKTMTPSWIYLKLVSSAH